MKKLLLILSLALLITGCGNKADEPAEAPTPSPEIVQETPEPTVVPTEAAATPTPTPTAAPTPTVKPTATPKPTKTPSPELKEEPKAAAQDSEPAPEPTVAPTPAPEVKQQPTKDQARKYIGSTVGSLTSAIGKPNSSDYAPSCLGDGEDGELFYNGFTVYTYRENGVDKVTDVR